MLMHQGSQAPRIQPSQAHAGPQTSGSGPQRPIGSRLLFWPADPLHSSALLSAPSCWTIDHRGSGTLLACCPFAHLESPAP